MAVRSGTINRNDTATDSNGNNDNTSHLTDTNDNSDNTKNG